MKNLLSIIAFAFVMLLSTQNISAQNLSQNQDRPEVAAKAQLHNLTNQLGLSGEQGRTIYRALVTQEVNSRKAVLDKDAKSSEAKADLKKVDSEFYSVMKKTLKPDQLKKWESSLKN